MVDKLLKELKETYGLDFPDMDYVNSDDKAEMIRQLEDLSNLCSAIIGEIE